MMSQSIRAWSLQKKFPCSVLLYQTTPIGIFYISDVESEIRTNLEAIEWLSLSFLKTMEIISRIEIHAISGIAEDIIQDTLEKLIEQGLITPTPFDEEKLQSNIKRIPHC